MKRQCSLPNQDSWCARLAPAKLGAVAVFDGHGQSGHMASHFVKEALTKGVASAAMSRADPSADVENWFSGGRDPQDVSVGGWADVVGSGGWLEKVRTSTLVVAVNVCVSQ